MRGSNSLLDAVVLPLGLGYGTFSGTTVGATISPNEPFYDSYYDPNSPDFGGEWNVNTVFYVLRGVPAGALLAKGISSGNYFECYFFSGEPGDQTPDDSGDRYLGYCDNQWPSSMDHPGGTITIMVLSYHRLDGSSPSEVPGPFGIGWGSGILDQNPSHYGPWVGGEWIAWADDNSNFPPDSTTPRSNFSPSPPQMRAHYGIVAQWSADYAESDTVTFDPPRPINPSIENAVYHTAARGHIGGGINYPDGNAKGTIPSNPPYYTGYQYFQRSGGLYHPRNSTLTKYWQGMLSVVLEGPLLGERSHQAQDSNAWGLVYEDGKGTASVSPNKLRNLEVGFYSQNFDEAYDPTNSRDFVTNVFAYKNEDRVPNGSSDREANGGPDLWEALLGGWFHSPERITQELLGTLPTAQNGSLHGIIVADPMLYLHAPRTYETAASTDDLDPRDAPAIKRTEFWIHTASQDQLLDECPLIGQNITSNSRTEWWISGTIGNPDGTEIKMGYIRVEYQRQRRRDYMGPEPKLKIDIPMRQRHRDDGLATDARQQKGNGSSLQSSIRRGGRTYY